MQPGAEAHGIEAPSGAGHTGVGLVDDAGH